MSLGAMGAFHRVVFGIEGFFVVKDEGLRFGLLPGALLDRRLLLEGKF